MTDTTDAQSELEQAKQVYRDKPKERDGRMTGCTSYLQRKMHLTYNHATAIINVLEQDRFISAPDSEGKRKLVEHYSGE